MNDQCPGVSVFHRSKGYRSQYGCRSRREKPLWQITKIALASLHWL